MVCVACGQGVRGGELHVVGLIKDQGVCAFVCGGWGVGGWGGEVATPLGGAAPSPQPVCEKKEGEVAVAVLRSAASVLS